MLTSVHQLDGFIYASLALELCIGQLVDSQEVCILLFL